MRETFTFDRADRLADILFGVAAAGGLITYEPLAHQVGMRPDHLRRLLAEVSRRSAGQSGPIWTALAISARTGRPGDGFYRLARELRADCSRADRRAGMAARTGPVLRRDPAPPGHSRGGGQQASTVAVFAARQLQAALRSEERRVGKECRL